MGTWGYKLYEDDISCDIKESFDDYLKNDDYDCEKTTQRILQEYKDELDDIDSAPVIWFALADLQWKRGMLLDYVKEKAIYYIDSGVDLQKWECNTQKYPKRKLILDKLKIELLSEQPPRKKKVRRSYECPWSIGDTFAYRLLSEEAKYNNLYNKYLILIKVGESWEYYNDTYHKSPVFRVKITKGYDIPTSKEEIDDLEYVLITHLRSNPNDKQSRIYIGYELTCITSSKRSIPKDLIFIGNYPNLKEPGKHDNTAFSCFWKFFDHIVIHRYNRNNLGNKEYDWWTILKKMSSSRSTDTED